MNHAAPLRADSPPARGVSRISGVTTARAAGQAFASFVGNNQS
ncbi:hypothetical protein [Yinghuangia soli]|nr:hypothetical protein [Yinghuangia soli]